MPRTKKDDDLIIKAPEDQPITLHALFTAAALAGLIARGNGASALNIIPSAIAYADAVMESYK